MAAMNSGTDNTSSTGSNKLVIQCKRMSPTSIRDNLVLFVSEDYKPGPFFISLDKKLNYLLTDLLREKEITGTRGDMTIVHTRGMLPMKRIILCGTGDKGKLNCEVLRNLIADLLRKLRNKNILEVTFSYDACLKHLGDPEKAAQAICEGAIMGLYSFTRYISRPVAAGFKSIAFTSTDAVLLSRMRKGVKRGQIIAEATNMSKDIANEPANVCSPLSLSEKARSIADSCRISYRIMDENEMNKLGLNLITTVGRGSGVPPKFIIMCYKPKKTIARKIPTIIVLGKGVTFDSGGLSLKDAGRMMLMKRDMTGGASALAVITAVEKLKIPARVFCLVPAVENMIGTNSYKPSDIIRSYSGKTVEIMNTDAEGRLVMADAITYAQKHLAPDYIIDIATLTGGITRALGTGIIGMLSNNQNFVNLAYKASEDTGEKVWQLPLELEYRERVLSHFADLKNSSQKPPSTIAAALFLNEFVDPGIPWLHFDIAGCDTNFRDNGYISRGASGVGVRLIISIIEHLAQKQCAGIK